VPDRTRTVTGQGAQAFARIAPVPARTKNKFGIDAVFSTEPLRMPETGEQCEIEPGADIADNDEDVAGITGLNCAGFGSAMVVTASFGLVAAAHVLRKIVERQ